MVGAAEVEVDKETGQIDVIDYVGVIDCGTPINPNLARVQAEGGIGQGIGMVLYEDVQYTDKGKIRNNSFMQYKIPNRMDIPKVRIEFESSYEKTGPFRCKIIGELVSIHHVRLLPMQFIMQQVYVSENFRSLRRRLQWESLPEKPERRCEMQELILAIAGLILELLVFFCAGSLLTRILKIKAEITMELVLGYLLYFAVFEYTCSSYDTEMGKTECLFVSVDGDHGSLCTGCMSVRA